MDDSVISEISELVKANMVDGKVDVYKRQGQDAEKAAV